MAASSNNKVMRESGSAKIKSKFLTSRISRMSGEPNNILNIKELLRKSGSLSKANLSIREAESTENLRLRTSQKTLSLCKSNSFFSFKILVLDRV